MHKHLGGAPAKMDCMSWPTPSVGELKTSRSPKPAMRGPVRCPRQEALPEAPFWPMQQRSTGGCSTATNHVLAGVLGA
jgi:hypothetical protein